MHFPSFAAGQNGSVANPSCVAYSGSADLTLIPKIGACCMETIRFALILLALACLAP